LIIILGLLVIGFFIVRSLVSDTSEEKNKKELEKCLTKVNSLKNDLYLERFFSTWDETRNSEEKITYLGSILNISESQQASFLGLLNKNLSCQYDVAESDLVRQQILNRVVLAAKKITGVDSLSLQSFLAGVEDYTVNHQSGNYKIFYNELISGSWEGNCEEKLAPLCRPGEIPLTFTGAEQWCQNICQKLTEYKNNKEQAKTELLSERSSGDHFFRAAVAFWLGGRELARQACAGVQNNETAYDNCQNMIARLEVRAKSCEEIKDISARFICGK